MSRETNEHELLSAYFDGELSPEDRLRTEQLLEESSDARRDIDGVAELSELVKSLPAEAAPAELLPAVLRRAERETLFSTNDAPSAAAVSKDRPRSWLTVIAGIAATAAAVLVTVQILPTMSSGPAESSVADISAGRMVAANNQTSRLADDRLEFSKADASSVAFNESFSNELGAFGSGTAPMAESPAADEPLVANRESARNLKLAESVRPAETKPADRLAGRENESATKRPGNGGAPSVLASSALSLNADALQNVRRGDVLPFFSTSGTAVTTYMVTVVDIKQALNQMQVLLARNDIPAHMVENDDGLNDKFGAEEKTNIGKKDRSARASGPANKKAAKQVERLFAVYVETTPDRFTSALKDLLRDKLLADLHPKPPVDEWQIELTDLGQSRRQLFSRLSATAQDEKKIDAGGQRFRYKTENFAKRNPARKDAPTGSPRSLRRKSIPLVQTKSTSNGSKAAPAADASKPAQPAGSKTKDNRDKPGERTDSIKRFADVSADGYSSFQLRVQLAPLPTTAELEKQQASESRAETAGKAEKDASSLPQNSAYYVMPMQVESGRAALVRVLFVFREAPQAITP
jgi:anti-sigma-K factor RskA